jgi:hypothetical protein
MIVYIHMRHTDGTAAENAARNRALSPWYGQVASYHSRVPAAEIRHVYVNSSTTVAQVVTAIAGAAVHERSLFRLMINCHGSPGLILLGQGITVANVGAFSRLRRFMTPGGSGITVGCCYAASGRALSGGRGCIREQSAPDNGLSLLMELARLTGVNVEGALDEQLTWELNGPVLTVRPDSTYAVRMGRTAPSIRSGVPGEDLICRP